MNLNQYLSEFVYALAGALLGFLLMKMDDVFNNKQYTRKEYSKFTLACYLATLAGLFLMKFAGPVKMPSVDSAFKPIQIPIQTGGSSTPTLTIPGNISPSNISKTTIPSNKTAFFQPSSGAQALRFATGVPTF